VEGSQTGEIVVPTGFEAVCRLCRVAALLSTVLPLACAEYCLSGGRVSPFGDSFFACSRWYDADRDWNWDPEEFQNSGKTSFSGYDDLTFVAYTSATSGITYRLYGPDGTEQRVGHPYGQAGAMHAVYKVAFTARELSKSGGAGTYTIYWYRDGSLIGQTSVHVSK
jgi:hypothetical protein